ncbi:MAG: hypothetical protein H7Z37_13565, partial [Pyrinomonadaceae bacterium]|nr:hypothetical protein [Pyrinomonadaceae bacterium]
MKNIKSSIIGLLLLFFVATLFSSDTICLTVHAQNVSEKSKICEFINGNWFDGNGFKRQTFYSVNGFLTRRKPSKIDETVDLKNGFVIPPFGDAHTHNLDGVRDFDRMSKAYFDEGTF